MNANPEQAAQNPAQQRPYPNLIRPEELQKATFLDDATRTKYTMAFRQFWSYVETKPAGSTEHQQALSKLTEWSQKLRSLAQQHRMRLQQQAKQQQAQQAQAQQQTQSQDSQASAAAGAGAAQAQAAQNAQQQAAQQAQQQQAQAQAQAQAQTQGQQGAAPARPNPQTQIPPAILQHVSQFQYALPPNIVPGTPEAENKIKEMKHSYALSLTKQEYAAAQIKRLNQLMDQRRKEGQEIGPDLVSSRQQQEQAYNNMKSFVEDFRKKQQTFRDMSKARQAQGQQAAAAAAGTAQAAGGAAAAATGAGAAGAQKTEAAAAGAGAAAATQAQSQPAQIATAQAQAQANAARPTPSPATSQPPSQFTQPVMAQQGQQGQQQPNGVQTTVRPPSLPGQAPGQISQINQGPQSSPATQTPSGGPIPLTHHAAVTAAAQSHTNRTGTPQQASTFRASPHENPNSLNNPKMPIPKQLTVAPPQPVSMGPSRPTLGGPSAGAPGMMGQPAINKLPAYMLEGEGDRVLSKKKLDELVRQVTGGGEGIQAESLTAEVEEAMLQLADDFVDNVISSACKLSKLRESQQLDVRDIQLVLERNYNIRIPGYASDEIRTVRKLHPTSAWSEKMKALQAAKIMGGKTDL